MEQLNQENDGYSSTGSGLDLFSPEQQTVIQGIVLAFEEDSMAVIPAVDSETNQTVPILCVFTDEETYIPVGLIFTPKVSNLDQYIFPGDLEDVDIKDGLKFVYSDDDQDDYVEENPGWWTRLLRTLRLKS
jgi:hypothetical protein